MRRRRWIVPFAIAGLLSACGSGSSNAGERPSPTYPTTTTAPPCGASQENCTPAQVILRVTSFYEQAGATAAEAACLAPITAIHAHAVNEAFAAFTAGQTRAAAECVGTDTRLRLLAAKLSRILVKDTCDHFTPKARKVAHSLCDRPG